MIYYDLLSDRGILVISPKGALERADFEMLAAVVDPYIAEKGKLNGVMIEAESFPGWDDFGALVSHVEFVEGHHEKIARLAVVSDSAVLSILPHIASHFVSAEVRQFPYLAKDEALHWLSTGHT
jgi:hypothetical protein